MPFKPHILAGLTWLQAAPRRIKQTVLVCMDGLVFPLLLIFVLTLRLEHLSAAQVLWTSYVLPLSLLAVVFAALCRVYSAVVRVYDEHFLQSCLLSSLFWVVTVFGLSHVLDVRLLPYSVILGTGFLWLVYLWTSRWFIRAVVMRLGRKGLRGPQRRLAIYGAGQAGRQLMGAIQDMPGVVGVCFFDDDPQLIGTRILGVPVLRGLHAAESIQRLLIEEVILAMPAAGRARQRAIVESLEQDQALTEPLRLRVLPGLDEIVDGQITLNSVREIDIRDLLGRESMPVHPDLFAHHVADRVVLVTGAAGSIGSELCRQILTANPETLVLLDHSEFGLYVLEEELRATFPRQHVIPILGSVMDQSRLERIMRRHRVQSVYHAAAYKHVPLVEANPFEGLRNNAVGTWRTALAAEAAGVESFVLVSTDKAVRPTNVMGASKRLSELALQALASESKTVFSMVRFGNVLGSSGSVIPRFRQQIAEGGPLTLTHPDITRFFMTIPEAAQLVIQAGGLAQGGEVFLLEMGEPVRIIDLARRMIRLSGLTERTPEHPEGDIEIVYTGLRPGEKLFEELLISDEHVTRTIHERIYQAREPGITRPHLLDLFDAIDILAEERDTRGLKRLLMMSIPGYKPDFAAIDHSTDLHDRRENREAIAAFEAALAHDELS